MRVVCTAPCFVGNALREPGDVFEVEDGEAGPWVEERFYVAPPVEPEVKPGHKLPRYELGQGPEVPEQADPLEGTYADGMPGQGPVRRERGPTWTNAPGYRVADVLARAEKGR